MVKTTAFLSLILLLTACAQWDYEGIDPRVYNEVLYPKKITVRESCVFHSFFFEPRAYQLDSKNISQLDVFLNRAYPSAVQTMNVSFGQSSPTRELYVTRLLRARGYKKSLINTTLDNSLDPDEVMVNMTYTYAEPPICPDWKKDPTINYSNTTGSNAYCATATNLAKQIANPSDLIGASHLRVSPDGNIGAAAIDNYRTGKIIDATASSASDE